MDKETIKQALIELHQEGCFHIGCPWNGVEDAKIDAIKKREPLPEGAVKMVLLTWNCLSSFGKRVGNAIAAGMFIAVCALIVAGAFGFGKVASWIASLLSK